MNGVKKEKEWEDGGVEKEEEEEEKEKIEEVGGL